MEFMGMETFKIEILGTNSAERLLDFYMTTGFGYREYDRVKLIESVENGSWTPVVATLKGNDVGGYYLNWDPKYHLYRRMGMPELQDLRVLQSNRRHGIATALIQAGEEIARGQGRTGLGISVGLHAEFGAAQRLYVRLGYIPDGLGVTYDREVVPAGEKRPIDDDLALMMLKLF